MQVILGGERTLQKSPRSNAKQSGVPRIIHFIHSCLKDFHVFGFGSIPNVLLVFVDLLAIKSFCIHMEDLAYVRKHGVKNSYTFIVDSSKRDTTSYPSSAEYVVEFMAPFRKVLGIEVVDAHIPRTERAIAPTSNTLVYQVGTDAKKTLTLPIDNTEFTPSTLVSALNDGLENGLQVTLTTGKAVFTAPSEFLVYAQESGLSRVLGFAPHIRTATSTSRSYTPNGLIDVTGPRYVVIRSPEIESIIQRDRTFEQWNPGLGMVKFPAYGMGTSDPDFTPYPQSFGDTPLARLTSFTLRLEKPDGTLYDTGYLDHALIMRITWIDAPARSTDDITRSQLNPHYTSNPLGLPSPAN